MGEKKHGKEGLRHGRRKGRRKKWEGKNWKQGARKIRGAVNSLIFALCTGPEKRHIPHKVVDSGNGVFRIEFTTVEVSVGGKF